MPDSDGSRSLVQILENVLDNLLNLHHELVREGNPSRGRAKLIGQIQELIPEDGRDPASVPAEHRPGYAKLCEDIERLVHKPLAKLPAHPPAASLSKAVEKCAEGCTKCSTQTRKLLTHNGWKPPAPLPRLDGVQYRAILVFDLVQFTLRVMGAGGILAYDDALKLLELVVRQIEVHATEAILTTTGKLLDAAIVCPTGDGAVMHFPSVLDALRFTAGLHGSARLKNSQPHPITDRWLDHFRVGVCYGPVKFTHKPNAALPRTDTYGIPFIYAARMSAAADVGEAIVSEYAWRQLNKEVREFVGREPERAAEVEALMADYALDKGIPGKKSEPPYSGYRRRFVRPDEIQPQP